MFSEFQQPGYLHVLINHLPIVGTAMGVLALAVALFLRQRAALIPALVVVLVAGISAWPVSETGSVAYKPIRKISDDAGSDWLDEHQERADRTVWTFYVMAGLAAAALVVPVRWPRTAVPLAAATALAAVACTAVGGYIAQPGGRVRHIEFRPTKIESVPKPRTSDNTTGRANLAWEGEAPSEPKYYGSHGGSPSQDGASPIARVACESGTGPSR